MVDPETKLVNSILNIIGVNSLRLRGLHLVMFFMFSHHYALASHLSKKPKLIVDMYKKN